MFVLMLMLCAFALEANPMSGYCNEPEESFWWELLAAPSWPGGLSSNSVFLLLLTIEFSCNNSHILVLFFFLLFRTYHRSTVECHTLSKGATD